MDSQSKLEVSAMSETDKYRARLEKQSGQAAFVSAWKEDEKFKNYSKFLFMLINFQMLAIIGLSIGLYFYVSADMPSDRFFVVSSNNARPRQIPGLYRPNNSRDALGSWVSDAVVDIMTFGFNDYTERFRVSRSHFTKDGWMAFRKAVQKTGFIRDIEASKQILTAAPRSTPVLLKDGLMGGRFTWVYEMDLMLTYRSGASQSNSAKKVRVFVQKIPTSENPKGVGISSLLL